MKIEDLIKELESKKRNCKNTNTIFDTKEYILLEDAKELLSKVLNIPIVKHLGTNCKHCLPNAYSKYHHDRYYCTIDTNNNKVGIPSPENCNCNRHEFNGA